MTKRVVLFLMAAIVLASACGESARDQAEEVSCRSDMRSLAAGQAMYFGEYERYARSIDELAASDFMDNAADLRCPTCNEQYDLESDGQSYTISCPCDEHGSVVDGRVSWQDE